MAFHQSLFQQKTFIHAVYRDLLSITVTGPASADPEQARWMDGSAVLVTAICGYLY